MSDAPQVISGIEAMRGVGQQRAKGFWADAWSRVLKRGGARFGLVWIGVIAFFAIFAPHNIHAPLQVPAAWLSKFSCIEDPRRQAYAAKVAWLDTGFTAVHNDVPWVVVPILGYLPICPC